MTQAYIGHLQSVARGGTLGEIVAAVLPCYWIYGEVGKRLYKNRPRQPKIFREWIEIYASETFWRPVREQIQLMDRLGAKAKGSDRRLMSAGRAALPERITCGNCSQQCQSDDSKRIIAPRYWAEFCRKNCLAIGAREKAWSCFSRTFNATSAFINNSVAAALRLSLAATASAPSGSLSKTSKIRSSTAVCTMRASTCTL